MSELGTMSSCFCSSYDGLVFFIFFLSTNPTWDWEKGAFSVFKIKHSQLEQTHEFFTKKARALRKLTNKPQRMTFRVSVTTLKLEQLSAYLTETFRSCKENRQERSWSRVAVQNQHPKEALSGEGSEGNSLRESHRKAGVNQRWGVVQGADGISWFPMPTSFFFSPVIQLPDSYKKDRKLFMTCSCPGFSLQWIIRMLELERGLGFI